MTETPLPANSELLVAAYYFRLSPTKPEERERLMRAVELPVDAGIYEQLRIASNRALSAPRDEIALACEAIGDLISALADQLPPKGAKSSGPARMPYAADD